MNLQTSPHFFLRLKIDVFIHCVLIAALSSSALTSSSHLSSRPDSPSFGLSSEKNGALRDSNKIKYDVIKQKHILTLAKEAKCVCGGTVGSHTSVFVLFIRAVVSPHVVCSLVQASLPM